MKDLHIHTKYSDGEYDEYEIIEMIKKTDITEFSICDHNTIEGSQKVYDLLKKQNSKLIFHTGVELTSRINGIYNGVNVHILVRDFDFHEEPILKLIEEISEKNLKRAIRMKKIIYEEYGIKINDSEIDEMIKTTNCFGKPHMYKLLCKYGAFDREEYYKKMRKLNSDDLKLDVINIIKTVHEGKGNVFLAHPIEIMEEYGFSYDDIEKIICYLKENGLDGIEVYHSKHDKNNIEKFEKIARKYNLKTSAGSDYHGPNVKPNVKLGKCIKEGENY